MANRYETEDKRRIVAERRLAGKVFSIVKKLSPDTPILKEVQELMDAGAAYEARQALIRPVVEEPLIFLYVSGGYENVASEIPVIVEQLKILRGYTNDNDFLTYSHAIEVFTAYSLHR